MPMRRNDQLNRCGWIDIKGIEVLEDGGQLCARFDTRIDNDPVMIASVNGYALAVTGAENRNFNLIMKWGM